MEKRKAVLISLGTRGDIEPFLAIAQILSTHRWDIRCIFPEQFREEVEKLGYTFHGFDKRFLELIESPVGKQVMSGEGSWFHKIQQFIALAKEGIKLQKAMIKIQHDVLAQEDPDLVMYHPKSPYATIWGMDHPKQTIMLSPLPHIQHPVSHRSILGVRGGKDYGKFLNRLSYKFVAHLKTVMTLKFIKPFKSSFKSKLSHSKIYRYMLEREPSFYAISPSLFPKPPEWGKQVEVVGYFERNKTLDWSPDPSLLKFLESHPKIAFFSFGSMTNNDPEAKTKAILEVVEKHQIPTIINQSWGGLTRIDHAPEYVHFVKNIPYDWIFSRVYGVVHHGGSGTTHSALKYGCASLIIPHIVDQFYWNDLLAEKELAPRGIPIKSLTAKSIEPLLLNFWNNPIYRSNAEEIARSIQEEHDEERLYQKIMERLGKPND